MWLQLWNFPGLTESRLLTTYRELLSSTASQPDAEREAVSRPWIKRPLPSAFVYLNPAIRFELVCWNAPQISPTKPILSRGFGANIVEGAKFFAVRNGRVVAGNVVGPEDVGPSWNSSAQDLYWLSGFLRLN